MQFPIDLGNMHSAHIRIESVQLADNMPAERKAGLQNLLLPPPPSENKATLTQEAARAAAEALAGLGGLVGVSGPGGNSSSPAPAPTNAGSGGASASTATAPPPVTPQRTSVVGGAPQPITPGNTPGLVVPSPLPGAGAAASR